MRIRAERRRLLIFMGTEMPAPSDLIRFLRDPAAIGREWLNNADNDDATKRIARRLRTFSGLSIVGAGNIFGFYSVAQQIEYTLEFSTDRADFVAALKNPEVGVVYIGHARFGRGACFGPSDFTPGDHWNEGDGEHTGIFKMGWDYIGVPADDIERHQYRTRAADTQHYYTTTPLDWTMRVLPLEVEQSRCDPDLRSHYRELTMTPLGEVVPDVSTRIERGASADTFFCYRARARLSDGSHDNQAWHMVVPAGAADLRRASVQCRFLAHMACASRPHNAEVFREVVGPTDGDRGHGVWLSELAVDWAGYFFLYGYLTTPGVFARRPWSVQLRASIQRTNRWLDGANVGFELALA